MGSAKSLKLPCRSSDSARMRGNSLIVVLSLVALLSCASIEGTRDKSRTTRRTPSAAALESVAVLPVPDTAEADELAFHLGDALTAALRTALPTATVLSPEEFGAALGKANYIERFGMWKAGYEQTSILDPKPLPFYAMAARTRHLLLVRSVSLDREKIRAVDTGRSGSVSDANNVWRSRLRLNAELIDASTGVIVWRGVGEAENINSPRKDMDYGLVIVHQANPDLDQVVPEMVQVAATGIAHQLTLP